jgi:hypothetical protein
MIFWLVLKLEISYRIILSWRILVSFRGFFEDFSFAWWKYLRFHNSYFALRCLLMYMARPHSDTSLVSTRCMWLCSFFKKDPSLPLWIIFWCPTLSLVNFFPHFPFLPYDYVSFHPSHSLRISSWKWKMNSFLVLINWRWIRSQSYVLLKRIKTLRKLPHRYCSLKN